MNKRLVLLLVALVATLALAAGSRSARAGAQDFQLFNRTGVDIYALHVAPSDTDNWEEDLLHGTQLLAGADILVSFDPSTEVQYWDIRVEDHDGNSLEWHQIDLISATQVILEDNGVARIK